MKKLLLASILFFGFLQQGNAQRFDYDNTSNFFIGLNAGSIWHTSDVKNVKKRFPLGAGFIAGGTMNRDYGKLFTYDLRLRFLLGSWYGQDRDTTSAIQNNTAVNSLYDTLGYAVQNFRAKQRSLDLEFSVHFNRVKENTGIDPYLFGGIGFTFTKTRGDLLKGENSDEETIYAYDKNPSASIIDKEHNTPLDKNSSGDAYDGYDVNFLPSLGIGIGYYFNSNFSIGLEHKTTFFNSDYFDGTDLNQDGQTSNIKNDLFHYTNLYIKLYLNKGKSKKENLADETPVPPKNDERQNFDERKPAKKNKPSVNFTNPSGASLKTSQPSLSIRANTAYVNSADDVTFTHNGNEHSTFIFNPKNHIFKSEVNLDLGKNVFRIEVKNSDGKDDDETVVYYQRETPQEMHPPIVNIVDPETSPMNVNLRNYVVKAAVHNINTKEQISVTFNDRPFDNFSFNPNENINFNANLNLREGVNRLKVKVSNQAGKDEDETVLIYTKKATDDTGRPPVVNIVTPDRNPFTTSKRIVGVTAKIKHVKNEEQIQVVVNGVTTSNVIYNSETEMAQFNVRASSGFNTIRVKAENPYGTDQDELQIIQKEGYNPEGNNLPPLVSITTPSVNPYNSSKSSASVTANVLQISRKQQIEVKVNGVSIKNFIFDKSTNNVQFNTNLSKGSNIISIKAKNNFGSDSDDTQIIYKNGRRPSPNQGGNNVPCNSPQIQYISPKQSETAVYDESYEVKAKLKYINNKSQITVFLNSRKMTDFSYNASTKTLKHSIDLMKGKSQYIIRLKNRCSTEDGKITLNNFAPICGVNIDLKNSDFCLGQSDEVVERDQLLKNDNFQYNGTTSSLYFKAANNGHAKVNGKNYALEKGTYYRFLGSFTVDLKKVNNQWHVCVTSSGRDPLFGKGASRPDYPCGNSIENTTGGKSKEGSSSKEKAKPAEKTRPNKTRKPRNRNQKEGKKRTPNKGNKSLSKPESRNDKRSRKPKGR